MYNFPLYDNPFSSFLSSLFLLIFLILPSYFLPFLLTFLPLPPYFPHSSSLFSSLFLLTSLPLPPYFPSSSSLRSFLFLLNFPTLPPYFHPSSSLLSSSTISFSFLSRYSLFFPPNLFSPPCLPSPFLPPPFLPPFFLPHPFLLPPFPPPPFFLLCPTVLTYSPTQIDAKRINPPPSLIQREVANQMISTL